MAVSPKEVEKYLAGADYPARKQDLIKRAEQNNAPQEVLDTIKRMPDETFNKPTDVAKAIGQFA